MIIIHAGDCHEVLGVRAAPLSSDLAASRLLAAIADSNSMPEPLSKLRPHRRAQAKLEAIFHPASTAPLHALPDETVLYRFEQKTVGDLRHLIVDIENSAREIKLNGRFGMGRCQGRFCSKWTLDMLGEVSGIPQPPEALTGRRWPVWPLSIKSLAGLGHREDVGDSASTNTR